MILTDKLFRPTEVDFEEADVLKTTPYNSPTMSANLTIHTICTSKSYNFLKAKGRFPDCSDLTPRL